MSLIEIKRFNVLIGNKPFIHQPVKVKQELYEKLIEMSRMMTIHEEICQAFHIIKIVMNSLV